MSGYDIRVEQDGEPAPGEPFYIRQHGAFHELTPDERGRWFHDAVQEARKEGAQEVRMSVDDADNARMALVEAWKHKEANQGELRWQLQRTKGDR